MSLAVAPPAVWQSTLFGHQRPRVQALHHLERIRLDEHSWVDLGRDIVHGSDELFASLHNGLPWERGERPMYDRVVAVPRLTSHLPIDDHRLPASIAFLASSLAAQYGRAFDHVGVNLYRDGGDSVAWHGDRVGRRVLQPIIAILSLGGSRVFRLRPKGGGPGRSIPLHSGDMLVMGGHCQHEWEHAVPKVRRAQPRISVTFRHDRDEADGPTWQAERPHYRGRGVSV
jgi:alkylated DNA repair dioxygenase AlkB